MLNMRDLCESINHYLLNTAYILWPRIGAVSALFLTAMSRILLSGDWLNRRRFE